MLILPNPIKETILNNLSVPPTLSKLAKTICVSESKMKQLFRQIFGKSIYNYYQTARMNEAANLLKQLSVSETGYKLGFISMSHFSKVFEKYHGATPKKLVTPVVNIFIAIQIKYRNTLFFCRFRQFYILMVSYFYNESIM